MRFPAPKLSLTARYALFVFGVIAVLLVASQLITANVVRSGLKDLFTQRLERSATTLTQYADVHFIGKVSEIEAIISSPRFIAAVETMDSATVANEAPYYRQLLESSVFIVEGRNSEFVYGLKGTDDPDGFDRFTMIRINEILQEDVSEIHTHYVLNRDELFELFHTSIVTYDGLHIGTALIGERVSSFMIDDLEQLTGFDVILTHGDNIVARSSTELVETLIQQREFSFAQAEREIGVHSLSVDGREALLLTQVDERLNVGITFVGDLEAHIQQIVSDVRTLLLALAALSGLLALIAVYTYTSRRIGSQMKTLVTATERIADGDLEFTLTAESDDEIGQLTAVVDRMRERLKENLDELQVAHGERIEAERLAAIGKSATGIVHDFKGPMAVARGSIELMQFKNKSNTALTRQCRQVLEQLDHMNELMRDILEYSKGKFNLKIEATPLKSYLTDIRAAQLESFDRAGIQLLLEGSLDLTVKIDPARFRRVIDNILNNAREALKPGNSVTICCERRAQSYRLIIADDGPGIPEEILDTIFEPFVTSGKEGGTGLGLSISRKIVEDHNCNISVESRPEQGATFTITLPESIVSAGAESETAERLLAEDDE